MCTSTLIQTILAQAHAHAYSSTRVHTVNVERSALSQHLSTVNILICTAGHGKKKKKWQQGEPEEEAGSLVPAGPKKEVPKPYMSDAKFVTSEFRTTGMKLVGA